MNQVFLDTGYVVALESATDQYHATALAHWGRFIVTGPKLVTTSYILDEIAAYMNNRARHDLAVNIGRRFFESPSVEFIHVDEPLFQAGWDYFSRHSDKRYSLTDCISFVVMADRGITQALAFDRHFEQAGFERLPHEE